MNAEPRYNDIYYKRTTSHSQLMDVHRNYAVAIHDIQEPIDFLTLFGNTNPIEIEIGFGKGRFLLDASKMFSDINYIGIERAQKYVELTCERFKKYMKHHSIDRNSGMFDNVRLAWTDANFFISRYVPDQSVQAYHIYFPDPWPKLRQQKRRIFRNKEFLQAISNTLISNRGQLYLATDYEEYFIEIQERLSVLTNLKSIPLDKSNYIHIATNFEMKYRLEGRNIFRAIYIK